MARSKLKPSDIRIRVVYRDSSEEGKTGRKEPLLYRAFELLLPRERKRGGRA